MTISSLSGLLELAGPQQPFKMAISWPHLQSEAFSHIQDLTAQETPRNRDGRVDDDVWRAIDFTYRTDRNLDRARSLSSSADSFDDATRR